RLTLVQLAEGAYQFILSFHHLLFDGWSFAILLKEVFAYYEAFYQSQDLRLERSRPYGDYIAWLQRQDLSKAEMFWRQALKGFMAPTPLGVGRAPMDPSGEEARYGSYDEQQAQLSEVITAALQ